MCRQAAFPNGFKRAEAIEILQAMEGKTNVDGFGYAYLDDTTGKIIIKKWALSLTTLLRRNIPVLAHMEHNSGWTIAHSRAASVGGVCRDNSHPFMVKDYAITHNGHWYDHKLVRLALSSFVNFTSDTDSESAAHLISVIGPEKFVNNVDHAGVYLCLKSDGSLEIAKTSGSLAFSTSTDKRFVLSSELDSEKYKEFEMASGYFKFDKNGKNIKYKKKEFPFYRGGMTGNVTHGFRGQSEYNFDEGYFRQHQSVDEDETQQEFSDAEIKKYLGGEEIGTKSGTMTLEP